MTSRTCLAIIFCFGSSLFLSAVSANTVKSYYDMKEECLQREAELGREGLIQYWTKPAKAGDAKAQLCLGLAIKPPGIWIGSAHEKPDEKRWAQDARDAVEWIRRSAEQGLAAAQEALADAYYRGSADDGVSQDRVKARYWVEKAASQGSPFANIFLGEMYRDGEGGLSVDKLQAYQHLRLGHELLKAEKHPAEFYNGLVAIGLVQAINSLSEELSADDRKKADTWVKTQLQKLTKP